MALARFYIRLIAAFVFLGFSPVGHAWEVCNETSFILRVATATQIDGALTPKGWTRSRPGDCLTVEAIDGTPRYVFAESSNAHQGGIREWHGARELCANEDDFEANVEVSCALQDMGTRNYISIDPSEQKTSFIEIDAYETRATTAGIQRLLKDLGYTVPKIDGRTGRQTNRSLSKFLKSEGLKSTTSDADKIDALEKAALEKRSDIGITICNKAGARLWSAVAYRRGANWESRGWWAIDNDQCLRPHTQSIKNDDAHVFALLETDGGEDKILKSTTAVPSQFCIAESRFSATERKDCADRGYRAASFRPLPTNKEGATINLSEADFVKKKVGGLRQ